MTSSWIDFGRAHRRRWAGTRMTLGLKVRRHGATAPLVGSSSIARSSLSRHGRFSGGSRFGFLLASVSIATLGGAGGRVRKRRRWPTVVKSSTAGRLGRRRTAGSRGRSTRSIAIVHGFVDHHGLAMHATTISIASHHFAISFTLPVALHELAIGDRTVVGAIREGCAHAVRRAAGGREHTSMTRRDGTRPWIVILTRIRCVTRRALGAHGGKRHIRTRLADTSSYRAWTTGMARCWAPARRQRRRIRLARASGRLTGHTRGRSAYSVPHIATRSSSVLRRRHNRFGYASLLRGSPTHLALSFPFHLVFALAFPFSLAMVAGRSVIWVGVAPLAPGRS